MFTPLIGAVFGQPNFLALVIEVGRRPNRSDSFLDALISFLIMAFVLFLVIKAYNRAFPKEETSAEPTEIELLTADTGRAAGALTHFRV